MDYRIKRLNATNEEREYRRSLPYTVSNSMKGAAAAYNEAVEKASLVRRIETRQRTIEAWTQVQANRTLERTNQIRASLGLTLKQKPKLSIFTRICNSLLNFFLNINY